MLSSVTIDPSLFRRTLSHFCTGIVVIAGYDRGGPVGFTAQSLVSLSLDPPLIGFSPSKTSETWSRLRNAKRFCVSILSDDQHDVCRTFSRRADDRFTNVGWSNCASGLPVLDGALAYISCTLEAEHDTGDHFFVVGCVDELEVLRSENEPLLFFRGEIRPGLRANHQG
ncbi:flavin reductase family protein [Bradyrhizobium sp. S3.3.6]|uniref:flavin reductase family protein n=1 Tax=Bradyrhizobium sp. S3.3.6 TaxID=3156429 RepID=UPI00339756AC